MVLLNSETCSVRLNIIFAVTCFGLFVFCFLSVPQVSSKPSPSKRRCSEENVQPAVGEENQQPTMVQPVAPLLPDPPTDKKPPAGPTCVRPSSSLEKTATRPVVQSQPGQLKPVQPQQTMMAVDAADPMTSSKVEMVPASPALQGSKEPPGEDSAPAAAGMKSRLQRLADQRKCWDGKGKNN